MQKVKIFINPVRLRLLFVSLLLRSVCGCVDALTGSYIAYVEEDEFLEHMDKYIDNAFEKSQNDCLGYDIQITA